MPREEEACAAAEAERAQRVQTLVSSPAVTELRTLLTEVDAWRATGKQTERAQVDHMFDDALHARNAFLSSLLAGTPLFLRLSLYFYAYF